MSTNNTIPLHTIEQVFPASVMKKALKLPVRELEEAPKGTWVAFVDETSTSFDVQIVLQEGIIAQHQCDCEQYDEMGFCIHQLAVLQQLSTQKLPHVKPAAKRKVKQDALDIIINQVEVADLRLWVKDILKKHKDLLLAFTNQFTSTPTEFEASEMLPITENGMKAVVKNKKKIDQTELKKILTLWQNLHEPIINFYISNVADADKADVLGSLIAAITECEFYLQINTNKIETYKKNLLQKTIEPIYEIENEPVWQQVISKISEQPKKIISTINYTWYIFLDEIVTLETRKPRIEFLLSTLLKLYNQALQKKQYHAQEVLTKLLWRACTEKDMLHLILKDIKPIEDDIFNNLLIQTLLEKNEWALAETHCHKIISENFNENANIPYLEILKDIYKQQGNRSKELIHVLKKLIPYNYNYDDYLLLIKTMVIIDDPGDWTAWRNRLIKILDQDRSSEKEAALLYYNIMVREKPSTKLITELTRTATIEVVLTHYDSLFKIDKKLLLKTLAIFNPNYKYWEKDGVFFKPLLEKIEQTYHVKEISDYFMAQDNFRYRGRFYDWVSSFKNRK